MEKRLEKGFGSSDTESTTNGLSQVQLLGYVHICTYHTDISTKCVLSQLYYMQGGEDIGGDSSEKPLTPVQDCVSTFIRKRGANFQPQKRHLMSEV